MTKTSYRKQINQGSLRHQSLRVSPKPHKHLTPKKKFAGKSIDKNFLTFGLTVVSGILSIVSLGLIFAPSLFTTTSVAKADDINSVSKPKIITDFHGCHLDCNSKIVKK